MAVVYTDRDLEHYMRTAVLASPEHPVLIDRFLEDATEVDVDAVADGERVVIAGIMEHIEEAGVHSGDSACVLPPLTLPGDVIDTIRDYTRRMAEALEVRVLLNVQYAIQRGKVFVLEVNPRASRTVPFVSKATGIPWAKVAAKVMAGKMLDELGVPDEGEAPEYFVKAVVFPFMKFPGVDTILGPEMRSTGEVMGSASSPGLAFAKAFSSTGYELPTQGTVFLSVVDHDKAEALKVAKQLKELGFEIMATEGTAEYFRQAGIEVTHIFKVGEGPRPHVVDRIKNGDIDLIINTPFGRGARTDDRSIRTEAVARGVPCITTLKGAAAAANGIRALQEGVLQVTSLQEYHGAGNNREIREI